MYVAKYLLYSNWLLIGGLTLLCVALLINLILHKSRPSKPFIINIQWNDKSSIEIYSLLKNIGVTLDDSQKKVLENQVKGKYSHKTLGFMR